ncbi:response regulator [Ideonella alba]|uniref:Response regulator transcription factor n=1 Tax=Ideonella alba TaxID=2824118 RepID=A0A940Y5F2_9BURK|nr:response regulator transcription factor [Ideonella alba]MBQ0930534.1 response regulator transcription factor [Ideonella alba]
MRVLLVEDDAPLARSVSEALGQAGFTVEWLDRGETAESVLLCTDYDLAILDIGLPGISGLALLRRIRHAGRRLPVLMLTARDALEDRVRGLDEGADDYLVKPFQTPELVARCHALVRRGRSASGRTLGFGPLQMDVGLREARLGEAALALTGREWDLLEHLLLSAPEVVAKQRLIDSLSRWDNELTANAVEIYASRLRGKLAGSGVALRTVRGLGYRLELDAGVA